jgi:predicted ArsR family transcriptional regulator
MESRTLNTSQIATRVGINFVDTRSHLKALENGGVLTHINFGRRIRYYRFKESAKANAVRDFIEAWCSQENMKG